MARSKNRGIKCPKCSEFGLKVIRSTPGDGFTLRRLKCDCGHRLTSVERPINEAPPTPTVIDNALRGISIGQLLDSVAMLQGSGNKLDSFNV